jgi:CubicO group peptidase (beta-lactamase class C family)
VPEPDFWPTGGWQSSTPEEQGMDSTRLAEMLEEILEGNTSIHSILVIRNGYLVTEAYFQPYVRDTRMHVQSVTKSVMGMLVGKAITDGLIASEEEKLVDFYPGQVFEHLNNQKSSIRLKHLLSMTSGLDCQEFSSSSSTMEQTREWVRFMLDLPVVADPGKQFGYCNGNAHLLSSILEKATGMSAREYANQELFTPLGIPSVPEADWGSDPQNVTMGGYGLHLRPVDLAKLAFLYLHNGQWEGQQLISPEWVAASITQHIQKEDGSGYGYLWTVYPEAGHYAALGLGGQQIHIYPSRNLIVIVTATLESFAEAPEIENMLNKHILPAIQGDGPLPENANGLVRLQNVIQTAAHPIQPVPPLPATAEDISGNVYSFEENPLGWQTLELNFEDGANTAVLRLQDLPPLEIGLDNLYRLSEGEAIGELFLRGRWTNEKTFVIDYPYPIGVTPVLGELGEAEFRFVFNRDALEIEVEQLVFGGEASVIRGIR